MLRSTQLALLIHKVPPLAAVCCACRKTLLEIHLHLELSNLPVEAIFSLLMPYLVTLTVALSFEEFDHNALQLLLPLPDLVRMHFMALRNLVQRFLLSQGLQGHFGFELGGEGSSLFNGNSHFIRVEQPVQFYPTGSGL